MNFDDCRHFLSSPQSYDTVELKPKKIIKKKRKTIHKHLLNTNILLENDPSKLTMRQRILQQKFQNKKNTMEDLDLISSGIEVNSFSKNKVIPTIKGNESQYKIKLPVCSKIRLQCDKVKLPVKSEIKLPVKSENKLPVCSEIKLPVCSKIRLECNKENYYDETNNESEIIENEIIESEIKDIEECKIIESEIKESEIKESEIKDNEINDFKESDQIYLERFTDEEENDREFNKIIDLKTKNLEEYLSKGNDQICLDYLSDEEEYLIAKNTYTVEEKIIIPPVNHKMCLYTSTELCLYRIFHSPLPDFTPKLKLEDCNIKEINEKLNIQGEVETSILDLVNLNLENLNLNLNSVNKPMLHKKRRVLFQESSKKKKEACIYKAAFYITKLEKLGREKEEVSKKCIYYTDILVKAFKERGCVCKVVGEVKWFLNLN